MVDAGEQTRGSRHNPLYSGGGRRRSQWNEGGLGHVGWNEDANVGSPPIIGDVDPPESVCGVAPPSKDDFAIEGDFTSCAVEVNVAPCID